MFAAGLAWIDRGVGQLLSRLHPRHSLVVLTSDHGASFLGKGAPYEAGIRVPMVMRWRAAITPGRTFWPSTTHLDLLPTLVAATAAPSIEGAHGISLLPALLDDQSYTPPTHSRPAAARAIVTAGAAAPSDARPIFIEVGYARAVRYEGWKLILVNDPIKRCLRDDDGDGDAAAHGARAGIATSTTSVCRNFHGQRIDRLAAAAHKVSFHAPNASITKAVAKAAAPRRFGLGNMTYDASARHPAFCARRQLYDLVSDPLEQTNLAAARPDKYRELLAMLIRHVRRVEAANPAIARQGAHSMLGCA